MLIIDRGTFEKVKAGHDLLTTVQAVTGQSGKRKGRKFAFHCPFHNERTPSFYVDPDTQHWDCFGACSCGGDLIDFITMLNDRRIEHGSMRRVTVTGPDGLDTSVPDPSDARIKAIEFLTGENFTAKLDAARKKYANRTPVIRVNTAKPITMRDIQKWQADRAATLAYFVGVRGLHEPTVDQRLLGTNHKYPNPFEWTDGRTEWFTCPRYVIPWTIGDQVLMTNNRRDDAACKKLLADMNPDKLHAIKVDMVRHDKGKHYGTPSDITEDDLVDHLFGGKYKRSTGGAYTIFNASRLFTFGSDNKVSGCIPHNAVFINESELSTIALEELGYPSVSTAFKEHFDFKAAFANVIKPIILADNDGGTGEAKARKLQEAIGNPHTQVVVIPGPCKDANEMTIHDQKHGTKLLETIAKEVRIEPYLLNDIAF